MYTTSSELTTSTVPAFLSKLWTLVEDPDTNELICWDVSGKSFHVLDQTRFAKEILPLYFKHNNIASFIRQLNMYGFRKVITVEAANIKMEKDDLEFAHPFFIQGQESFLEFIKRKASNPKTVESAGGGGGGAGGGGGGAGGGGGGGGGHANEDVSNVYADVAAIKGRQDSMTSKLEHLKIENEVLWKEVVTLRQRHLKQEQIVNKLIQFLVTLVGDRTLGGMKRKFPLMLEDGSAGSESSATTPPTKVPRSSNVDPAAPDISAEKKRRAVDHLEPLAIRKDSENHSLELTDLLEDVNDTSSLPITDLFPSTCNDLIIMPGSSLDETMSAAPLVSTDDELLLTHPHHHQRIIADQLPTTTTTDASSPVDIVGGIDFSSLVSPTTTTTSILSQPITTIARADNVSQYAMSDFDKSEMSTQLDHLQAELDHVRDVFTSSGTYNFDANTLFENLPPSVDQFSFPSFPLNMLFNPDASLISSPKVLFSPDYLSAHNLLLDGDEDNELVALEKSKPKNESQHGTVLGNELIQYNPPEDYSSLFDQFACGASSSSFNDPMGLHGQDDLDQLFETNQLILQDPTLDDHQ